MTKGLMVVDDDPSILFAVKELLEPEGFNVVAVSSGKECLQQMEKGFKGVILMDIMMPDMDGWQTVKEIVDRGYLPGNIISMFTARDIGDQKMESLAKYVTDYIQKPFDPEGLILTVREYSRHLG
jgi:CheY-like chemotaxis protein